MQKTLYIFLVLLIASVSVIAQSKKKDKNPKENGADRAATYGSEYKGSGYKSKQKLKLGNLDFDQKITEYEKRMEANVKKNKKVAKEMVKPQYSDPTYFGHKREPKKRKPGKRKFCKECEMVH